MPTRGKHTIGYKQRKLVVSYHGIGSTHEYCVNTYHFANDLIKLLELQYLFNNIGIHKEVRRISVTYVQYVSLCDYYFISL